jgi:hypothetical protein
LKREVAVFGAAIAKVYVEPYDASQNAAWLIGENSDPVNFDLGAHTRPTVKVEVFSNRDTWKYTISVPDYQLNSAFTSESEMASFIDACYMQLDNAMTIAENAMEAATEANFIGEKIAAEADEGIGGVQAINILHQYNEETNADLTVNSALKSADFLKYCGKVISETIAKFKYPTKMYNTQGYVRYTSDDRLNLHLLANYAAANKLYLEADTFHDELVKLPGYDEIAYWQGFGEKGDFDDVSRINITTSSGKVINKNGIIGIAFDEDAMGVLFDAIKQDAKYDPEHDLTKIWLKATKGYFNDLSENAVVFYLEEV